MADKPTVMQQVRGLKPNFWFANWMEANERLAFFGSRAILPLYMVYAVSQGGMGLTYAEKGSIFAIWALVQCLIPMISGGFTDQYGYKKSLYVAYTINICGYLAFAFTHGYWGALGAACLVGLGTAIFKPPVQGTIAKASTEQNSSIAWGIFYWAVNVGGFLAPVLAANIRGETNFKLVFICAAGVTAFNFIPTLFFYREPEKVGGETGKNASPRIPVIYEPKRLHVWLVKRFPRSASLLNSLGAIMHKIGQTGPARTIINTLATLKDKNFLIFLAIFSGFWFMFMQLWDLLPNFIDEWVFSRDIAPFFASISKGNVLASGNVKPEILINIDSFAIIALMLGIAWLTGKFHPMVALIGGMIVSVIAFVGAGATNIGLIVAVAIFVFAIGEMMCSPKFSEYIGLTAPPDKKAVYMGYSNIPFAIGWFGGNLVSGYLYERLGSKIHFARDYLTSHLGVSATDAAKIPTEDVMVKMASLMNSGRGATTDEATLLLWQMHHPWIVWVILGSVGLVATIAMVGYYYKTKATGISSKSGPEQVSSVFTDTAPLE